MNWKGIWVSIVEITNMRTDTNMKMTRLIKPEFLFACLFCVYSFSGMSPAVNAQKTKTVSTKVQFMGSEITPLNRAYMVRKDVNIRAKPKTGSKKVGKLKQGLRISTVGRAKGGWVAYRDDGKDVGFVYEPVLYPVIESALKEELQGTVSGKNRPKCAYIIRFVEKSVAEGQIFQIGDYEIDWHCSQKGKLADFSTLMFLTEGAYNSKGSTLHQITIDVFDIPISIEEVLSTNFLYNTKKNQLTYDGVSQKRLARTPAKKVVDVASVSEALKAAVSLAHEAWNDLLWAELFKQ